MNLVEELKAVTFEKAPFGYRVEEVDRYIDRVSESVSSLARENEDLVAKLEILAAKVEEYRQDEESMRSALIGAQKLGDSIVKDSKNKAESILREATVRAERSVESVQAKLELERRKYEDMKRKVDEFRTQMIELYKAHIEMVNMLPEYKAENPIVEQEVAIKAEEIAPTPEPVARHAKPPKPPAKDLYPANDLFTPKDVYPDKETKPAVTADVGSQMSFSEDIQDTTTKQPFEVSLPDEAEEEPTARNTPYQRYMSKYGELLFGDDIDVR